MDKSKNLNANIYEIRLDENLVNNQGLIDAYLFHCQCALFLIDISKSQSFELTKSLIINIDNDKFPYLKKILIENKLDLESQREVSGFEIKEFLDQYPSILSEKLSLKDNDNLNDLLSKIYTAVNEPNNILPINKVSISQDKNRINFDDCENSISLILIGDTRVGKTNFLNRYMNNKFDEHSISTIGIEKEIKVVKVDNKLYKLIIWDTAGQERFRALPKKYYKNVDGVLLLYDVSDKTSLVHVNDWLSDVKENSNRTNEKGEPDISLFLLANKIDVEKKEITREQGEQLAKSLGMKFFEISCKYNINIHEIMARLIFDCHKRINGLAPTKTMVLSAKTNKTKGGCCSKKE